MRIAIVGLGTAGACVLDSLGQALGHRSDVTLTLYDPAAEPWVGRVFQPDSDCILANAPVSAMSIRYGDNAHVARWLIRHGELEPDHSGETFLPRAVYGRYIADHSTRLVGELRRRGWRVEFVRSRAASLERTRSGYTVGTSERRDEHDYVILCAGGSVLGDPFGLDAHEGYVADPYPTRERLCDIPAGAAVGIVGSGLTAVDVAVALHARGHAGPVRMYSRSGVLPYVRRPGPDWSAEHLTDRIADLNISRGGLRLADLERVFDEEVRAWGGEAGGLFPPPPLHDPLSWLRRQRERPHDPRDLATFIFQKSVPTHWGDIWHALDPEDKRGILNSPTLRDIMSRCCPMPQVNADKLIAMLDSGQLSIHGGVETVEPASRGFSVHLPTTTQHADYVVNAATPATYGVHPGVERLVTSAVDQGLARRHACGGLEVAGTTGAVHGGRGTGGVYAVGDLTRGAFFFIFGLPVLVRRSADVAAAIHVDAHRRSPWSITMDAPRPAGATLGVKSPASGLP
jgi:uncharacterized NAD(P)/FAD-binding protein YdhS